MAKTTQTAITDESLLADVEAEINQMSEDELAGAAEQALFQEAVKKARNRNRQMSEEQKERQRLYNKRRNMKLKLLAQKAEEMGIEISEKQVKAALDAS